MRRKTWPLPLRYIVGVGLFLSLALLGWAVRDLFRALIIAGLLAFVMMPLVTFLENRLRWSHKLAANVIFFLALGLSLATPVVIVPPVIGNLREFSQYLLDTFNTVQDFLQQPLRIGVFTIYPREVSPNLSETIANLIGSLPENALHIIENASRNFAWTLVIIVTTYYLLQDWGKIREWLIRQAPEPYRKDARRLFLEIKRVWAGYMRGTMALMVIVGIFFMAVYLLIGLPGAVGLGLLIGLLSVIPDLGPLIGALIAVFVALVEGSLFLPLTNFWFAVLVLGIYTVFINFKNIWLRPRVLGRSVQMHEGLVFVLVVAAVIFEGILGALLVVPVFASAQIILRYLKRRVLGEAPFASPLITFKTYSPPPPLDVRREFQEIAEVARSRINKKDE
ncbi:MAG: AI-2E family transporter [Anaerolineae bacterium]|nr:MAG: AI-2E family transporter [Anaerolineae bacterium]